MKNKFLKIGVLLLTITSSGSLFAQADNQQLSLEERRKLAEEEKARLEKPYHYEDDAAEKIANLVQLAQAQNKNIILQVGGNWCIWCLRFHDFVQKTPELKDFVDANYLYYHLNYSRENKNEKVLAQYGGPGKKFGYPVFVVLDKNGKHIHTQSSEPFEGENGENYSVQKVKNFFQEWVAK